MVSVVKRPTGHKIIDQAISATITEAYGGGALVTFPAHSLSTGAIVYITSDIFEYNGFWYVTVISSDTYKISEHADADFVPYYQDADIEYYQTQEHDWSSIFLPIVYKITNDKWPTNTIDPEQTISSFSDDNGFVLVNISGSLRGSVEALEFVKISGSDDEGVYQIVEVISSTQIVLNMDYESDLDLTGATIQYYYNNFQVKVKVYAGLPDTHPWAEHKPYEEVASLSLTPDENNEVMFSVADYIQSKVKLTNNLTLFSLPLNLDAFTGFYISTGETYDDSDGYTLFTSDVLYADDSFEGYAIAGKLPFKNLYAGDYADYVYTSGSPALWLVLGSPIAVDDLFFDISFIKNVAGNFTLVIDKYVQDYLTATEEVSYEDFGIGVYRLPITPNSIYNQFCIRVLRDASTEEVTVYPEDDDLSAYQNTSFGVDNPDWTIGETLLVTVLDDFVSEKAYRAMSVLNGATLRVNYDIDITFNNTHPPPVNIIIRFVLSNTPNAFTDENTLTYVVSIVGSGTVHLEDSINVVATGDRDYFGVSVICGAEECGVQINSLSFGEPTTEEVEIPEVQITEEICIDMLETCEALNQFVQDSRRLLEDGGYRLLE